MRGGRCKRDLPLWVSDWMNFEVRENKSSVIANYAAMNKVNGQIFDP